MVGSEGGCQASFRLRKFLVPGEAKAQWLMREGLQALGWAEKELARRHKGDKGKVKLARQLRTEATMTLRWIADRLQMDSWTCVSNLLREKQ